MNLIEVMERFPDQESCIAYLERIRWRGKPVCPFCGCVEVKRKKEDIVGVWDAFTVPLAKPRSRLRMAQCFTKRKYHFKNGSWQSLSF